LAITFAGTSFVAQLPYASIQFLSCGLSFPSLPYSWGKIDAEQNISKRNTEVKLRRYMIVRAHAKKKFSQRTNR